MTTDWVTGWWRRARWLRLLRRGRPPGSGPPATFECLIALGLTSFLRSCVSVDPLKLGGLWERAEKSRRGFVVPPTHTRLSAKVQPEIRPVSTDDHGVLEFAINFVHS